MFMSERQKLYETDSLRQLGKDLNESRKKLRKQGLLAMPNFYPWTVAKSFEFANKYNYNVTEVGVMVQDFM